MLWEKHNQQNHENKILGWKKLLSKKFVFNLIRILNIKHSLLQEIEADTFVTTIKSMQKLINVEFY